MFQAEHLRRTSALVVCEVCPENIGPTFISPRHSVERPLRGMNVNSKASWTYRLLADICRTYGWCIAFLCLRSYFWVRRILWLLKMIEKQDQHICIKFCFYLGKTSSETIQMMNEWHEKKIGIIVSKGAALLLIVILILFDLRRQKHWIILSGCDFRLKVIVD